MINLSYTFRILDIINEDRMEPLFLKRQVIDDFNHVDGIIKVVQIVVNKSIKYTINLGELLYLRCSE